MASDNGIDNQFIFRESEFENEKFHAASFVAKYRRVTSLESLRDQLRLYCDALKQQLYGIINRDYKDFITIATKLDGVDARAEHLRKPLVDLRLDLAALHDGMVSSMQTIEDKLRHREEVVTKRRVLEATLSCMEKLDTAEEIVLNVNQQDLSLTVPATSESGLLGAKGNGLRRRALLKSFNKSQGVSAYVSLSRDVFDCSELERAAHAAAQAQRSLAALSLSAGGDSASMNQRLLDQRLQRLIEQLVQRIRARLSAIFSSAVSAIANASSQRSDESTADSCSAGSGFPTVAFSHCLRALVALSKGDVAEEVVAETVTSPLAKPLLTHGRVDGNGGRGSYVGLQTALESLASQVMAALALPLQACADTFPDYSTSIHDSCVGSSSSGNGTGSASKASAPIDLIVRGVWLPVAALLKEKFSGMFSVGIAGTLARCYLAVESFRLILEKSSVEVSRIGGMQRTDFASHPAIVLFHEHWKLDLYLQLRTQEISGRLDRVCQLVGQHGLVTKVLDDVYSPRSEEAVAHVVKVSSTPGQPPLSAPPVLHSASLTLTLSAPELLAIRAETATQHLHLPLSEAFCTEIATCLHPSVSLRALSARFFVLSMRLVMRLEAHAAVVAEVPTPSFPKASLALLIQQQQQQGGAQTSNMTVMSTPVKASATPLSTPSTMPSSQSPSLTASIDDLVLLALDLDTLAGWLGSTFGPRAEKVLGIPLGSPTEADTSPLQLCLRQQQHCLTGTRAAVWGRVCSMLASDCKKGLSGVRAVAAKYRMTNKPAPETPSPYVEIILQPVRTFLDRHSALPASFVATADGRRWEAGVLEEVTAGYLMQVQALMETVKQMDSALQRRSKLRTAAPVGTNMADSDKIALQLFLDVRAYGEAVCALTPAGELIPSYASLMVEVAPAERLTTHGASASTPAVG